MVGTVYYPTTPAGISLPGHLPLQRQLGLKQILRKIATRATIKATLTSDPTKLPLGRRGRQDLAGGFTGWSLGESKQSREGRITA